MKEELFFYDDKHQQNFKQMLMRFPQGRDDREYRVACYILAHPEIFPKATRKQWENPFDDWMEEEDFSSGIRYLINLGLHLYGVEHTPSISWMESGRGTLGIFRFSNRLVRFGRDGHDRKKSCLHYLIKIKNEYHEQTPFSHTEKGFLYFAGNK